MSNNPPRDVTALLLDWSDGDRDAPAKLMPLVYDELRRLARNHLRRERADHTLQPTALVNEVYLRLIDQQRVSWHNRAQFFGMAAQLMRHVLVDHARSRAAAKRGGLVHKLSLDEASMTPEEVAAELVALDEALVRLAAIDERKSRIVEMRFFGGLSVEETAEALGISDKTVMRDWRIAKMWLLRELSGNVEGDVEVES
ncbi:MAG TPA: sigma-70 family RNA polymerase sigma factor [Pyrinomonadaceae bacterium]|nr:sigma-70 family RNA polymerase sigma factor [Pyrinomonadaceae bacterium]